MTFTFAGSAPTSRMTASACAEKASLSSIRSTSSSDQPTLASSFRTASTGVIRSHLAGRPLNACPTMRAMGATPSSAARSSAMTTVAAAPSLTPGALPAVTVPPFFLKAGRNRASASAVVSGRTASSYSSRIGSPRRCGISTGRISSLKKHSRIAVAAFRWLPAAKASWSSRLTP